MMGNRVVGEDRRGLGPDERLTALVTAVDETADRGDQVFVTRLKVPPAAAAAISAAPTVRIPARVFEVATFAWSLFP